MAARDNISSAQETPQLCQTCGKRWPAGHVSCPDDGTALGDRTLRADPHALETMLITGARGRLDDRATVALGESPPSSSVLLEELRVSDLIPYDSAQERAPQVSTDLPELSARTHVGEYEIERKIGQGGMGTVYLAVHPILGKRAAIKIISDEMSRDVNAIARFRREARAVAQLASPHIVDVFGFGELPDGRSYYVMAYLSGQSLRERLDKGRMPLDDALDVLDQIARGLEVAHNGGIVHRDLKPENIFIESGPPRLIKLLDFGLVKLANNDDGIATTQTGLLFGTPVYISPEQIKSAGGVDRRADIYSLGCVAYELVLGRVPFTQKTIVELIAAHLEREPPSPRSIWPEMPAVLDALLRAMLAKDPAKRPTLGHVQETIERLRTSAFAPASSIAAFEPPQSEARSAAMPSTPWLVVTPSIATIAPSPPIVHGTRRFARPAVIAGGLGVVLVIAIAAITSSSSEPVAATNSGTTPVIDAGVGVSPTTAATPIDPPVDAAIAPPVAPPPPVRQPVATHAPPGTAHATPAQPVTPAPAGLVREVGPPVAPTKPAEAPIVPAKPKPITIPPTKPPVSNDRDRTVNPFPAKQPR